jgi:predicted AlkP superfamily phosphohydrolase/phosphomutase
LWSEKPVKASRVFVIGLDSTPPELIFEKFKDELPNLSSLTDKGVYGSMESCHPPITIPAWMVMVTGKDPGTLGMYGFRHRRIGSYTETYIVNSLHVKEPTIWDILSTKNKKSCIIGVPPGYPPKPVNGYLVSCFITPNIKRDYTHPTELKYEIEKLVGEYVFDVEFRVENRHKLLKELYEATDQHFKVLNYLVESKPWDFFMFVEICVDRVHHAFWKFFDKNHHLYQPGNEFENVIEDYYKHIDTKIGELLKKVGKDTVVIVVSDHGAKGMRGAFSINDWLIEKGYLAVKEKPKEVTDFEKLNIDWSKTKAWGWGGYYARIFLNVKRREPQGLIEKENYESFREELAEELKEIRDPSGRRMDTLVFKPEQLYRQIKGEPPDLMVYFDNLYWRSAGTVGHNTLYLPENDIGPDDAVHSQNGVYIIYDPEGRISHKQKDISIYDFAPTTLKILGLQPPKDMVGKVLEDIV